ncbi:HipA domain-containing protein [Microbacterium fluvii]|uniref:HipA domain-containing protein n=1 Tax=Microbacterium fluvii TaxID=415215 RepID=A0ABW2HGM1_9MICO|nr:HipA domain-containing protein [Microbacterium fluvii]MCU4673763.1 HipA domain-containing protein [Microbacterium fluvii]
MAGELNAYLDGVHVGTFVQTTQGALSFTYDEEYRQQRGTTPISLSMPLTRATHKNAPASAYLKGLLPDSDGRLRELGAEYHVSHRNPFAILTHIGRDAAGAVQLLPEGAESTDAATRTGDLQLHDDQDFGEIVRDLISNAATWGVRRAGRWSLPGAQPKTALFRTEQGQWATPLDSTPTTYIIKPAVAPYTEHHVNEFMTMAAARHLGMTVADSELATTALGDNVFISKRYDRAKNDGRWARLHQEDICQALGINPDQKYQSDGGPGIARIAELFRSLPEREDRVNNAAQFFDALVFNLAAVGTDAHAKNYSLMLNQTRASLAPLYDLGTHAPYPMPAGTSPKLAMSIDGEYTMDRIGEAALLIAARKLDLDQDLAQARVREILGGITAAFDQAATDAAAILGNDPAIVKVVDAIAANASARGWQEPGLTIPLSDATVGTGRRSDTGRAGNPGKFDMRQHSSPGRGL